jgi:ribosomal protein L7/L12
MSGESALACQILELFPGNKIEAIKLLREYSGLGLAEAKGAIDRLWTDLESAQKSGRLNDDLVTISLRASQVLGEPSSGSTPARRMTFDFTPFLPNRKIDAIKFVREQTGLGLKEAKDLVDQQWPVHQPSVSGHPEHEVRSSGIPLAVWLGVVVVLAAAGWYFLNK